VLLQSFERRGGFSGFLVDSLDSIDECRTAEEVKRRWRSTLHKLIKKKKKKVQPFHWKNALDCSDI
jgi:hypothetical protein